MLFLNLCHLRCMYLPCGLRGGWSAQCPASRELLEHDHVQAASAGATPLVRELVEIDFSYLSPEMNSVLN